jgi:hypothetical protein
MINFTSPPAFGFETSKYNSEGFYKEKYTRATQAATTRMTAALKNMQEQFNEEDRANLSGLLADSTDETMKDIHEVRAKQTWKTNNYVKAAGYIPLIGTLIGLYHISLARSCSKAELPNKYNHMVRGCIELTSCGCVLLIADIFVSIYRACCAGKVASPAPTSFGT